MVSQPSGSGSPWLSLGQASRLLGITPATLRSWSDQGEVATFVTPGGHRRFPRTVIEAMVPRFRARRPSLVGMGASPERMAQAYRRARPVERPGEARWLAALSDADRVEFREHGRRLLAVVLEHLDAVDRSLATLKLEQAAASAGGDRGRAAGPR